MGKPKKTISFSDLSLCGQGPAAKPGSVSGNSFIARFMLHPEVSPLFPYINAAMKNAVLSSTPPFIRFSYNRRICIVYSERVLATPFKDRPEAVGFAKRFTAFLNAISSNRARMQPNHRVFTRSSVIEILRLLPKNNCGDCGFPTCMAFAARLSQQETCPDLCPHMASPIARQAVYPVYDGEGNVRSTVTIGIDPSIPDQVAPNPPSASEFSGSSLRNAPEPDSETWITQPLSDREKEVLRLIARGATNTEISERLAISPHTVKSHVIHIFNKLSVSDRTEAAVWATRHKIV